MSELVTHEVQITAIDGTGRQQAYHLVECYTSGGRIVLITLLEVPIHVGVNQSEDDCLVAHQCLVVTFGIGDGFLILTSVRHLPEETAGFPVFILLLLDCLDPIVGDIHCHAVVKSITSGNEGSCQAGHTRHLFGNGDGTRVHFVNEQVGQCQIANGIVVLSAIVVVGIVAEGLAQSVAVIEHGGYTIEAETIELEFLHPILAIGEQEVEHLVLTIVKAE